MTPNGRRLARQAEEEAEHLRRLEAVANEPPATWAGYLGFWSLRWVVLAVMWAGITTLVTWVLTKALGPAVLGGLFGAIVVILVHAVKQLLTYVERPSRKSAEDQRRRWRSEREDFLRAAVLNRCNPSGRPPKDYPVRYRDLIEDLAVIAGEINAVIKVVDLSEDSITLDTGLFCADSVRKELSDRAARENRRLILRTTSFHA